MKVLFLVLSYLTLYLIFIKFRDSYQSDKDAFRIEILVIIAAGLAVLVNHEMTTIEVNY